MLPIEVELVSKLTGLSGKAKTVKRFERSNGLDTALYKTYVYLLLPVAGESLSLPERALRLWSQA